MPFNTTSLEVTGNPVPLVESVAVKPSGAANFSISDNGRLVYVLGDAAGDLGQYSLVWVDRDGREEPVAADPANYREFSLSPDGTQVAVRIMGDAAAVWIYDLTRDTSTRLTFDSDNPAPELPTSTPDGTRVAFGTPLAWKLADGTGDVETLSDDPQRLPLAFSPDGTTLVTEEAGGDWGLGMLTLDGDRTPTVLLDEEWNENGATLSPDGRWMAYTSDETRRPEVYVRPFPDVDVGKWQISTDGGDWPLWNPAGDELFYRGPDGMMALEFAADPTFTPVGHALGFYHVGDRTAMMTATGWTGRASFTDHELYHAQLAYEVGRGKSYRGWPFALWGGGPEPPLPPVFVVD